MTRAILRSACTSLLLTATLSSTAKAEDAMAELAALRAGNNHQQAAELGLRAVLEQPWDHSLRYLVADSLERTGRIDEAASQFSALLGTPLQGAAQGRLAALSGHARQASPAPIQPTAPVSRLASAAVTPAPPTVISTPETPAPPAPTIVASTLARPATPPVQPPRPNVLASAPAEPSVIATVKPAQPKKLGAPALNNPPRLQPPPPQSLATPAVVQTASAPKKPGSPAVANPPKKLGSPAVASAPKKLGSPAVVSAPPAPSAPATQPDAAGQIEALYAKGDYRAAAQRGMDLLASHTPDAALRLKIANSLAWSGQTEASQAQYSALLGSELARQAGVGLANTQRWSGRPDLALANYQLVLTQNPDDPDALEGLRQMRRELAPRTTIAYEQSRDVTPIKRDGASLAHRWNNQTGNTAFEVRLSGVDDNSQIPAITVERRVLAASVESRSHPLQPQLSLAVQQQSGNNNVFGSARIKLHDQPVWLRAARLDWGQESLSPRAGDAGMVAWQTGIEARGEFTWGQLSAQASHYNISDGNSINAAQAQWVPSWRPFGARWRPFLALDYRESKRPTPEYWSPSRGHGAAGAGLSGDWSQGRWALYGSAQYSLPILVESGNAWSLSLGGRYNIAPDLALSFNHWRMSSQRNNASYRARSTTLQLEKTWQ